MNVLHLSSYDEFGGAARAALRLHEALSARRVNSIMAVRRKYGRSSNVVGPHPAWRRVAARLNRRVEWARVRVAGGGGTGMFSAAFTGLGIGSAIRSHRSDVVHLHWIQDGFISLDQIVKIRRPLVWTFHDMWPFTGGCHFAGACQRFANTCGACPLLGSRNDDDLSRQVWTRKRRLLEATHIIGVAPSRWIAARAQASSLWQKADVRVVPNGLDLSRFAPGDPAEARERLRLPPDKILVTTGAANVIEDPRKGFDTFCEVAARLTALRPSRYEFVVFGSDPPGPLKRNNIHIRNLGRIADEGQLALIYRASDIFVAPSREDNLPNTLIEALACATPCAGFLVGGIPEIIDAGECGVLAKAFCPSDLAEAIDTLVGSRGATPAMRENARRKAEKEYSLGRMAERYLALYEEAVKLPQ